jgi:hypothetical protein
MNVSSISLRATGRASALAAAALALAALLAAATAKPAAPANVTTMSTDKVVALHEAMDRLWTDHVTWTRLVIVDFDSNAPDLKPDLARLLRNQVEIGNAIKPYYGAAAGSRLTALLHTHIMEAVPVLTYAQDGNKARLTKALAAWYANAHRIAAFLAHANPQSWPLGATTSMMNDHLRLTTDEAVAHLRGRWSADIAAYDRVRSEILMMADSLANGIVAQFPSRFAS